MGIIQQMSIDAKIIRDALAKLEIGQTMTYEEINALIGRDIRNHRSALDTARKALMADCKVFGTVAKVGLQRLDDTQKIKVAATSLGRIRRIARKASRTLAAVERFNDLPNDIKIQHNATMSICGAIQQAAQNSSMQRVERELQNNNHVLPVAETLRIFQN